MTEGKLILRDVRIVIIDTPTYMTVENELVGKYQKEAIRKGDNEVIVELKLPIAHPPERKSFIDEAKAKEPEERLILETLREQEKKMA